MKRHPNGLYQMRHRGALEGQPSPFVRRKAAAPGHPGEDGLARLRAQARLPGREPHPLRSQGRRQPRGRPGSGRVTCTRANSGQPGIRPAKAKLDSVRPVPRDPDEDRVP